MVFGLKPCGESVYEILHAMCVGMLHLFNKHCETTHTHHYIVNSLVSRDVVDGRSSETPSTTRQVALFTFRKNLIFAASISLPLVGAIHPLASVDQQLVPIGELHQRQKPNPWTV